MLPYLLEVGDSEGHRMEDVAPAAGQVPRHGALGDGFGKLEHGAISLPHPHIRGPGPGALVAASLDELATEHADPEVESMLEAPDGQGQMGESDNPQRGRRIVATVGPGRGGRGWSVMDWQNSIIPFVSLGCVNRAADHHPGG